MKHEDFIEKLRNLKTPEIELPGHKQALKMALLNSARFRERTIMDWARVLAPIAAGVLLIAVAGFFTVIQPQLQMDQAKEIARNDPNVQEWMEKYGLEITEVKLQNGQAFVLLIPKLSLEFIALAATGEPSPVVPDAPSPVVPGEPSEELPPGYILKVDLLEKKVTGFGEIEEGRALKDIKLEDIDFVQFEPSGGGS
jgi:hypothetical protein